MFWLIYLDTFLIYDIISLDISLLNKEGEGYL
jgi:hypothetical protein